MSFVTNYEPGYYLLDNWVGHCWVMRLYPRSKYDQVKYDCWYIGKEHLGCLSIDTNPRWLSLLVPIGEEKAQVLISVWSTK